MFMGPDSQLTIPVIGSDSIRFCLSCRLLTQWDPIARDRMTCYISFQRKEWDHFYLPSGSTSDDSISHIALIIASNLKPSKRLKVDTWPHWSTLFCLMECTSYIPQFFNASSQIIGNYSPPIQTGRRPPLTGNSFTMIANTGAATCGSIANCDWLSASSLCLDHLRGCYGSGEAKLCYNGLSTENARLYEIPNIQIFPISFEERGVRHGLFANVVRALQY